MDTVINVLLLTTGLAGALTAFLGETVDKTAKSFTQRITRVGWFAIASLLVAFSLAVVKEIRQHNKDIDAAEAGRKRADDEKEAARSIARLEVTLSNIEGVVRIIERGTPRTTNDPEGAKSSEETTLPRSTPGQARWRIGQRISYRLVLQPTSRLSSDEAVEVVTKAAQIWNGVRSARVQLEYRGTVVTAVNSYSDYDKLLNDDTEGSLVIVDPEKLIGDLTGQTMPSILSLTTMIQDQGEARRFIMLLNSPTNVGLSLSAAHEFGHVLGLGHSQANVAEAEDADPANDSAIPIMSPIVPSHRELSLAADDEAAISALYPAPSFVKDWAHVVGTVLSGRDMNPVLGVNVVAIESHVGRTSSEYSCVSDYRMRKNGEYEIWVRPGQYRLAVEPIRGSFVGALGVGPYARTRDEVALRAPKSLRGRQEVAAQFPVVAGATLRIDLLVQ